jgi:hypothetical protein
MKSLATAILILATSVGSGLLDGRTFVGELGPKGKKADSADTLIFANGTLRSTACDAYGFTPGKYTAVREGDVIRFTATTTSEKEGTIEWTGTVRGSNLDGGFLWQRNSYWVKAKEK